MPQSTYDVLLRFIGQDKTGQATKSAVSGLDRLVKVARLVSGAYGAIKLAQKGLEFVKLGAEVGRASAAFGNLAKAAGTSGDAIMESIQDASSFTIDRMTAMSAANKAMLMDVAQTPEAFERLTKVAVGLGRAMGMDAAQSIDKFIRAAGRQSVLIADDFGLVLSAAGSKAEFFDEMMTQGEAKLAALGGAGRDAAGDMEAFSAALSDMKLGSAEVIAEFLTMGGTLDGLMVRMRAFPETLRQIGTIGAATAAFWREISPQAFLTEGAFGMLEEATDAYGNSIKRMLPMADSASEVLRYMHTTNLPNLVVAQGQVSSATDRYLDLMGAFESVTTEAAVGADGMNAALRRTAIEGLAEASKAAQDAAIQVGNLAGVMGGWEEQQAAKEAIQNLTQAYKDGKIDAEEYKSLVAALQIEGDLASQTSIWLAEKTVELGQAFDAGALTAEQYATQIMNAANEASDARNAMVSLGDAIRQLPTEKVIRIRYELSQPQLADTGRLGGEMYQHGGISSGRSAWVGERGPELVRLPPGSRVHSAAQSRSITNNYNLSLSSAARSAGIMADFATMRVMGGR